MIPSPSKIDEKKQKLLKRNFSPPNVKTDFKLNSPVSIDRKDHCVKLPQFELLLDRKKVKNTYDYQQYNTPFKYDRYDNSEQWEKLHAQIKNQKYSKEKTDFYKGVNFSELKKELKGTDNVDHGFLKKLGERGEP